MLPSGAAQLAVKQAPDQYNTQCLAKVLIAGS